MPHAALRVVTVDYLISSDGLASGDVEVLVGMPLSVPPGCVAEELFDDHMVCVMRKDHPFKKTRISPKELAAYSHVTIVVRSEARIWLDEAMRANDLNATTVIQMPHFTSAALAVARTDHFLVFPRRLALAMAELAPLRMAEVIDVEMPPMPTSLVWHARTDADPAASFFRELIRESSRELLKSGKKR
jgi:DNA-binding transcriptional LysR family regulator